MTEYVRSDVIDVRDSFDEKVFVSLKYISTPSYHTFSYALQDFIVIQNVVSLILERSRAGNFLWLSSYLDGD